MVIRRIQGMGYGRFVVGSLTLAAGAYGVIVFLLLFGQAITEGMPQ